MWCASKTSTCEESEGRPPLGASRAPGPTGGAGRRSACAARRLWDGSELDPTEARSVKAGAFFFSTEEGNGPNDLRYQGVDANAGIPNELRCPEPRARPGINGPARRGPPGR